MEYLSSVKDRIDLARGTELEKKVKAATSPDNWGATGTLKTDIANATFDYSGFREVMPLVWQRIQQPPKQWTVIYKALCLVEHLVRHGSQRVIDDVRDNLSKIRMLQEFSHSDEQGRERGTGIRTKAKEVCDLVMDDELLRTTRAEAQKNRDKYVGVSSEGRVEGGYGAHYLQEYDRGVYGNTGYSDAPKEGGRSDRGDRDRSDRDRGDRERDRDRDRERRRSDDGSSKKKKPSGSAKKPVKKQPPPEEDSPKEAEVEEEDEEPEKEEDDEEDEPKKKSKKPVKKGTKVSKVVIKSKAQKQKPEPAPIQSVEEDEDNDNDNGYIQPPEDDETEIPKPTKKPSSAKKPITTTAKKTQQQPKPQAKEIDLFGPDGSAGQDDDDDGFDPRAAEEAKKTSISHTSPPTTSIIDDDNEWGTWGAGPTVTTVTQTVTTTRTTQVPTTFTPPTSYVPQPFISTQAPRPIQPAFDALALNDDDDSGFGDFVSAPKTAPVKGTAPRAFPSSSTVDTKHVTPKSTGPQQTTTPAPAKKSTELAWDNKLIDLDLGKPKSKTAQVNISPLGSMKSLSRTPGSSSSVLDLPGLGFDHPPTLGGPTPPYGQPPRPVYQQPPTFNPYQPTYPSYPPQPQYPYPPQPQYSYPPQPQYPYQPQPTAYQPAGYPPTGYPSTGYQKPTQDDISKMLFS